MPVSLISMILLLHDDDGGGGDGHHAVRVSCWFECLSWAWQYAYFTFITLE